MNRRVVRLVVAGANRVMGVLEVIFPGPTDDTMALAQAVGVVPAPVQSTIPYVEQVIDWHAHPAHRPELEDTNLGQLIELWGRETR